MQEQIIHYQVISDLVRSCKMNNVTFVTYDDIEYAIIDRGNEEFSSMLKSTYDEMIARETASL